MTRRAKYMGAAAGAAGAALAAYAVRWPSATLLAPSIHRGAGERRSIALTFDDGPSESTPALLEILAKHNATATFFQCGRNARRLAAAAAEVAAAGHEIGNHTETHRLLAFASPAGIERELALAQESIEACSGRLPRFFRAPYGVRWPGLAGAQRRLGLMGVMWTAIGVDWKWTAGRVASRLLRRAGNGAIFCLHDGRALERRPDIRATLGALERLLPELIERGYRFEKVSEIICRTKN